MKLKIIKVMTCLFSMILCLNTITIYGDNNINSDSSWPAAPKVNGTSAILMDARSGAILYEKKSTKKMYPASITKILTALICLEQCKMDDLVTFSYDSVYSLSYGDAHIAIDQNEKVAVKDCLYGLLLASANEVANGLAEHVSDSNEEFGKLMTNRAKEAGALNSNFTNPSGLHNKKHYTTAYDMAMITRQALKLPDFVTISGTTSYIIPPTNKCDENRPVNNKHRMVWPVNDVYYDGIMGGKTGYTKEAGNTLVTYATNGDLTLICVVLNSNTGKIYNDTKELLDYGFNHFESINISTNETRTFTNNAVSYEIPNDSFIVLPNSVQLDEAIPSIETSETENETNATDAATVLNYIYEDHFIGSCNLICSAKQASTPSTTIVKAGAVLDKTPESYTFMKIVGMVVQVVAIIVIFCAAVFGVVFLYLSYIRRKRRLQYRRLLEERRKRNRYPL